MRVAIAEDSVLLREGLARLLHEEGLRGRRPVPQRGRPPAQCAQLLAGCRDRRHPPAADAHRRGSSCGARDPRAAPIGRRPRPLAVRRARARAQAARGLAPRASATCSRTGSATSTSSSRAVRRVAAGRFGARPDHRLDAARRASGRDDPLARLTPREREVLELMAAGSSNQGDRRQARDHARARREVRLEHLRQARPALDGERVAARARRADVPALLRRERPGAHQKPEPQDSKSPALRTVGATATGERDLATAKGDPMRTRIIQDDPRENDQAKSTPGRREPRNRYL